MFGTLATILVIVSLALGGAGVTVASAQVAQPVDSLYSIKIWSEDARLALTINPSDGVQLALEFANRRVEEIKSMLESGSIPPELVELPYQRQVEQAIRLALKLPDDQSVHALEQIRIRLQTQLETMYHVNSMGNEYAKGLLYQTRLMIQERLQWVENAKTDPNRAREEFQERNQEQNQQNEQQYQEQYQNQNGKGSTDQTGDPTGLAPASVPWTTGTPTPGSSYGPGPGSGEENPWTTGIPTPGSSYGDGSGTSNPWTTGTPTPFSSYGPGPGTGTCTATCDGSSTCGGSTQGAGQPSRGEPRP